MRQIWNCQSQMLDYRRGCTVRSEHGRIEHSFRTHNTGDRKRAGTQHTLELTNPFILF